MEQPTELAASVDRAWTRPAVLLPVFTLIALVAGALPSFSISANLLVLCIGGALFWLGISHTLPRRRAPSQLSGLAVWWLLPVLVLAINELVNFMYGSTEAHPTLSLLADPVLTRYLPRAAAFYGWLAGFWGMVRR